MTAVPMTQEEFAKAFPVKFVHCDEDWLTHRGKTKLDDPRHLHTACGKRIHAGLSSPTKSTEVDCPDCLRFIRFENRRFTGEQLRAALRAIYRPHMGPVQTPDELVEQLKAHLEQQEGDNPS